MKKLLSVFAIAATFAFLAAPRAQAQTAQFSFTPTSFADVTRGSTITFTINLVFTGGGSFTTIEGLSYFLRQSNPASGFPFTIVGRDTTGSVFSDLLESNATVFAGGALNPNNDDSLGGLLPFGSGSVGSGTYFIANITLSVASNAPATTYTISSTVGGLDPSTVSNSNGDEFPIQPGSLTVTVVPEPSTVGLLLLAGSGAAVAAYRRRKSA
jgi:hypothetical protein